MNASGIYAITAPSGGQYIGSAVNIRRRWHEHKIALRKGNHKNSKLQNAWKKYGEGEIAFTVLLVCRPADLILFEQRSIDVKAPRYNICRIADSSLGVKRSDESKAARSLKMKGVKQSPELIAKRVAGMIGHSVSAEARARIGAKHIGNSHSVGHVHGAETRKRMSDAQKARFSDLRKRGIVPRPRLGHTVSVETRAAISAKLMGTKRSLSSIAKHRATLMVRRLNSVDHEVQT